MTSEDKPECFGEVNTPQKYLEARGIEYPDDHDCKECPYLKECIKEYNRNAYEHWIEESYWEDSWEEEHEHKQWCDYVDTECLNGYDCINCDFFHNYIVVMEEREKP